MYFESLATSVALRPYCVVDSCSKGLTTVAWIRNGAVPRPHLGLALSVVNVAGLVVGGERGFL